MLKNKKVLIAIPLLLLPLGYLGYGKFMKAAPSKAAAKKIEGSLVSVGEPFTLDLAKGRFARISVTLLVSEAPKKSAEGASDAPALEQNDAVRAIVTDLLTGVDSASLIDAKPRHGLQRKILKTLKKSTDVPVTKVLFTDLAVQ